LVSVTTFGFTQSIDLQDYIEHNADVIAQKPVNDPTAL